MKTLTMNFCRWYVLYFFMAIIVIIITTTTTTTSINIARLFTLRNNKKYKQI